VFAQHALDAVERAADDRDVFAGDAIGRELFARQREQPRVVQRVVAIQALLERCGADGGRASPARMRPPDTASSMLREMLTAVSPLR
jgi:hypothetical protein